MEEDIALSNIALDQLGVARLLLSRRVLGATRTQLAYLRRRLRVPQLPAGGAAQRRPARAGARGDFGVTMAKLLFLAAHTSCCSTRAAWTRPTRRCRIADKARKESALPPSTTRAQWTVRLGDGTDESHAGCRPPSTSIWPYAHELFDDDPPATLGAAGVAPLPSRAARQWLATVDGVLRRCHCPCPPTGGGPSGGRDGRHTEHLSYLLAEMQVLHRAHPGATLVSPRDVVAAVVDPGAPGQSPSTSSASCAAIDRDRATGRVTVDHHADLLGLPGHGRDPGRHPAGAGRCRAIRRGRATVLRPAWTTDMISEAGRRKLAAAGIAPPSRHRPARSWSR